MPFRGSRRNRSNALKHAADSHSGMRWKMPQRYLADWGTQGHAFHLVSQSPGLCPWRVSGVCDLLREGGWPHHSGGRRGGCAVAMEISKGLPGMGRGVKQAGNHFKLVRT